MGSGGPRGLQILRSGVKSVRGGFDSHAFPPQLTGAALALLLGIAASAPAAWAAAPAAPADSARSGASAPLAGPSGADSSGGAKASAPDTSLLEVGPGAKAPAPAPPGAFDRPRWVMLRSLAIPGWGQLHNHAFIKAAAFAGVEGWLGARVINDNRSLGRLRRDVDDAHAAGDDARAAVATEAYNRRLDRLVAGEWLLAGVLTYAMLDAYVDAHFRRFKVEFQHDPALPEGFSTGTGARLSLRWSY